MKRKNGSVARVYNKSLQLIDRSLTEQVSFLFFSCFAAPFFFLASCASSWVCVEKGAVVVCSPYRAHQDLTVLSCSGVPGVRGWDEVSVRVSRQKNEHQGGCCWCCKVFLFGMLFYLETRKSERESLSSRRGGGVEFKDALFNDPAFVRVMDRKMHPETAGAIWRRAHLSMHWSVGADIEWNQKESFCSLWHEIDWSEEKFTTIISKVGWTLKLNLTILHPVRMW